MSREQGLQFAQAHGCLFVETSAKCNVAVDRAFEELVHKVGGVKEGWAAQPAAPCLPWVLWVACGAKGAAPSGSRIHRACGSSAADADP